MTLAERLQRAERFALRLRAEGLSLDLERSAKIERLRLLARLEAVFLGCRVVNDADPLAPLEAGERHAVYFVSDDGSTAKVSRSAARVAEAPCGACGRRVWWESIRGAVVCGRCHPPARAELVSRWLGDHDA